MKKQIEHIQTYRINGVTFTKESYLAHLQKTMVSSGNRGYGLHLLQK